VSAKKEGDFFAMPLDANRVHRIQGWSDAVVRARQEVGLRQGAPNQLAEFLRRELAGFIDACKDAFQELRAEGVPDVLFPYFCECTLTHHRAEPEHYWPHWARKVGPIGLKGIGYYRITYFPYQVGEGPWKGWMHHDPPCGFVGYWPVLGLRRIYRYTSDDGSTRTAMDLLTEEIREALGILVTWAILPNEVPWEVEVGKEDEIARELAKEGYGVQRIEPGRVILTTWNPVPVPQFTVPGSEPPQPLAWDIDLASATGPIEPRQPKVEIETGWADREDRILADQWDKVTRFIVANTDLGQADVVQRVGRPGGPTDIDPPAPGQTRSDWILETFNKLLEQEGSAATNERVRRRLAKAVLDRARREHFSGGSGDELPPGWWRRRGT